MKRNKQERTTSWWKKQGWVHVDTVVGINRGSLAKIISFRGTHVGNTWLWFIWKTYRYIATKKNSQAKNLPGTEKTGDFLLSSIKLHYSKKIRNFEFNNNKNDLHHEKEHKTFKQFFYFSNGFRVIRCQTPIFKLEPSFYCAILVQSSHLKQK